MRALKNLGRFCHSQGHLSEKNSWMLLAARVVLSHLQTRESTHTTVSSPPGARGKVPHTPSACQARQGPPSPEPRRLQTTTRFQQETPSPLSKTFPFVRKQPKFQDFQASNKKEHQTLPSNNNDPHGVGFHYHPSLQDGCYTSRWQVRIPGKKVGKG